MKKMWLLSAAALVLLAACSDTTENKTATPSTAVSDGEEAVAAPAEKATESAQATADVTDEVEANANAEAPAASTSTATNALEEADSETVDVEEEPVHEADSETVDNESASAIEPSGEIVYEQNNTTYTAKTNFTTSSEQPFGLEVMDGFSLIAEEPGKDQLIFNDNSAITMAIETFTIGEVTYDALFTQAMNKAAALGDASPIEALPSDDNISNIAAFEVIVNGEIVVVMALETPTMLAQFTLMDTADRHYIDAMMQMAVTLQGQ